jgi:hypothetical protein
MAIVGIASVFEDIGGSCVAFRAAGASNHDASALASDRNSA